MFNEEKNKLKPFITQLWTKLTLNEDHFNTEDKKIFYVFSHFKGLTIKQVMPHLKEHRINDYATVNDLINTLVVAFDNLNKKATEQQELKALKQKDTKFFTFIALFQR